jgi:hypothetical protein
VAPTVPLQAIQRGAFNMSTDFLRVAKCHRAGGFGAARSAATDAAAITASAGPVALCNQYSFKTYADACNMLCPYKREQAHTLLKHHFEAE